MHTRLPTVPWLDLQPQMHPPPISRLTWKFSSRTTNGWQS